MAGLSNEAAQSDDLQPAYHMSIFRAYCLYISNRYGHEAVQRIVEQCGCQVEEVLNGKGWVSNSFSNKFIAAAIEITGDRQVAHRAGRVFASPEVLSAFEFLFGSLLLTPYIYFLTLKWHYNRFNRHNRVEHIRLRPGKYDFRLIPILKSPPAEGVCENHIGVFESFGQFFDLDFIRVEHPACVLRGNSHCEFKIQYSGGRAIRERLAMLALVFGVTALGGYIFGGSGGFLAFGASFATALFFAVCYRFLRMTKRIVHYFENNFEYAKILMEEKVAAKMAESKVLVAKQVAHDIRSPLAALKVLKGAIPAEGEREMLASVISRIQSIADDLLKKQDTQSSVGVHPQSNAYQINWLKLCQAAVAEKKVEWAALTGPKVNISFVADEEAGNLKTATPLRALRASSVSASEWLRVLSNLLNNAREASVESADPVVTLRLRYNDERVHVLIEDNGAGMPQSVIEKVLQGESTTTKALGNGLGLQSAVRLVRADGGEVSFSVREGGGTVVLITLQ